MPITGSLSGGSGGCVLLHRFKRFLLHRFKRFLLLAALQPWGLTRYGAARQGFFLARGSSAFLSLCSGSVVCWPAACLFGWLASPRRRCFFLSSLLLPLPLSFASLLLACLSLAPCHLTPTASFDFFFKATHAMRVGGLCSFKKWLWWRNGDLGRRCVGHQGVLVRISCSLLGYG